MRQERRMAGAIKADLGKKTAAEDVSWKEGAGVLLLVAAAQETGLLSHWEETVEVLAAARADPEPEGAQQTSLLEAQESGDGAANDETCLAHQERPVPKRTPLLVATPK